jgi:hypothetical protein
LANRPILEDATMEFIARDPSTALDRLEIYRGHTARPLIRSLEALSYWHR